MPRPYSAHPAILGLCATPPADESGRRLFRLPHTLRSNINDLWETQHVVRAVHTAEGRDEEEGGTFALDSDDEQVGRMALLVMGGGCLRAFNSILATADL